MPLIASGSRHPAPSVAARWRAWALGVALCLAGSAEALSADLTFWSWRVEDKAFYERVARDYEKLSGDRIKFQGYKSTEYPAVLSAALAAGGGPDLIHTRAYGALSNLSDAGYLLALTPRLVPNLAHYPPGLLDAARGHTPPHDQAIYGVPFATQSLGIYYNKALLAKAGVRSLPQTWAEFLALCRQLKQQGITPLANGSKDAATLEQLFGVVGPNHYGGTAFFDGVMSGRQRFTDPGFVRAIEEVVALKPFFPPNAKGIGENESRAVFALELAAFFLSGTWNIDTLRQLNPKLDFGLMAPPPLQRGDAPWVSTFADGNYSVNARTHQREAALKFVNHLASVAYGQAFTEALNQASAVPGTRPVDPVLAGLTQQAGAHGTPFVMLVGFRYQNPNGSVLLRDGLQKLLQGKGTPTQLAADVQAGLATWHGPFQRAGSP